MAEKSTMRLPTQLTRGKVEVLHLPQLLQILQLLQLLHLIQLLHLVQLLQLPQLLQLLQLLQLIMNSKEHHVNKLVMKFVSSWMKIRDSLLVM